jgi:hypothetical protein
MKNPDQTSFELKSLRTTILERHFFTRGVVLLERIKCSKDNDLKGGEGLLEDSLNEPGENFYK